MHKKTAGLLFSISFLLSIVMYGQGDSLQRRKMQSLFFLQGEWTVKAETRLSMGGPWESTEGKASFQLLLDSTLMEEIYSGFRQGKRFLSKTFFAVNNSDYQYQRVFIDAPHGVLLDYEGTGDKNGFQFIRTHAYANGRTVKLRAVYHKISDDLFTLESSRMPQDATEWDVTSRMTYTRQ
jgi:hypothetical protein